MTSDEIVDEIRRQCRPLLERGMKPDHIETSEQYARQVDSRLLRRHIITIAIDEPHTPEGGG